MENVAANNVVTIQIGNVKSRILFDSSTYTQEFQACMYAIDNKIAFLLPTAIQNKDYNTFLSDGTRKWDGKKHLFNPYLTNKYRLLPLEFYTGKIKPVLEVLYKHGYRAVLSDSRNQPQLHQVQWDWDDSKPLFDYQSEVINKAVTFGRGILKLATGAGKCADEESLLLTSKGMLEFREIYDEIDSGGNDTNTHEKILDVCSPCSDTSIDKSSHIYYDGYGKSYHLITKTKFELKATKEHKIRILSEGGDIIWKRVEDVSIGDICILAKDQQMFGTRCDISIEDAYWYGLLTGDGGLSVKNRIYFTNKDKHILDFVKEYTKNINIKIHDSSNNGSKECRTIGIFNSNYKKSINLLGFKSCKSIEKDIPKSIRESKKEVVAAFIRGLYETDGWVSKSKGRPTIGIGLSTKKLIDQLHVILLNFGIVSHRRVKKTKRNDSHILTIYREYMPKFMQEIGFDKNGNKYEKAIRLMDDIKDVKQNPNNNIIPNQNNKFRLIRDCLKHIYGYHGIEEVINKSNIKFHTFRSWMCNNPKRYPSRKNATCFIEWAKNIFAKNKNEDGINICESILELCDDKIFFDTIISKNETLTNNYDLVVPKTHSFVSQGFINHNTFVGANLIRSLGVAPVIFLVTSKDLLYQAKTAFENALKTEVGVIGDGHCDIKDINICTIQTCVMAFGKEEEYIKQCKEYKTVSEEDFDTSEQKITSDKYNDIRQLVYNAKVAIFDEAHHVSSETCSMILELCESAFFRYALGATIKRDDGLDPIIEALFGEYICDISPSFLIRKGRLIAPHIYMIPIEKYLGECETYQTEYKTYITENEFRNESIAKIANVAIKSKMPTLVLVKQLKHGDALQQLIPGSVFIQGKLSGKKRKELIDKMRNRELPCIIATALADEGLDIVCLECLILAGSGKSIVKAMQRIGRVIRKDDSNPKKRAIVYDFIDSPHILHSHALKRKKIYMSEPEFHVYDFRHKKGMSEASRNTQDLFREDY
jgi:superfamily II DNA or RNA helicase/intein/homing endonuclease